MRESAGVAAQAGRHELEEAAAVSDGSEPRSRLPAKGRPSAGAKHPRLRRLRIDRDGGGAARRHFGADVTAVCETQDRRAREIASERTRSSTTCSEDFTENGATYDVIFDAVGKHSFRRCRGSLKPGGIYIETDLGFLLHVPFLALATRWTRQTSA